METILYRTEERIGYLTLNRPEKYNAVDYPMLVELEEFWAARRYDNDTGVIVLDGGSAKGFCAGLDMKGAAPEMFKKGVTAMYDDQRRFSRLLLAMRHAPQPIIACVHGSAAGLGFSFAMAADVRVIAPDARFSAAYINIGLGGADMACSYFLPRLIGSGRANEFMLTGNWMNADDAMSTGFASRLVPREKLLDTGNDLAAVMASKNPLGLRMTKEAINVSIDAAGLDAVLEMEDRNQVMLILEGKSRGVMM